MKKKGLTVFSEKTEYLDLKKLSDAVYKILGQEDNLSAELEFVSEEEIAELEERQLAITMQYAQPESEEGTEGETETENESTEGESTAEGVNGESEEESTIERIWTTFPIDPATGYAVDPDTGEFVDPDTGALINGESLLDNVGVIGTQIPSESHSEEGADNEETKETPEE